MRRTWLYALVPIGLVVVSAGCAGHGAPPEWISHVPGATQELCAIGVSGPTYYHEDAKAASKTLALTALARAVEVKVVSSLTIQAQGDSRGSETSVHETSGFASDTVMKQAQVREQWIADGRDARYGVTGTVYTLVCMSRP